MSCAIKLHQLFLAPFPVTSLGFIQFCKHTTSCGMLPKLLGFPQCNAEEEEEQQQQQQTTQVFLVVVL